MKINTKTMPETQTVIIPIANVGHHCWGVEQAHQFSTSDEFTNQKRTASIFNLFAHSLLCSSTRA